MNLDLDNYHMIPYTTYLSIKIGDALYLGIQKNISIKIRHAVSMDRYHRFKIACVCSYDMTFITPLKSPVITDQ